jgi:hypothetical protein
VGNVPQNAPSCMDGEGRKFIKDNPIDPFYICKTNENGMGC